VRDEHTAGDEVVDDGGHLDAQLVQPLCVQALEAAHVLRLVRLGFGVRVGVRVSVRVRVRVRARARVR
jgi:hypothetical protein